MSQTFLTNRSRKGIDLEPIALVGHDAVLTRGRRSTKEDGALLTAITVKMVMQSLNIRFAVFPLELICYSDLKYRWLYLTLLHARQLSITLF